MGMQKEEDLQRKLEDMESAFNNRLEVIQNRVKVELLHDRISKKNAANALESAKMAKIFFRHCVEEKGPAIYYRATDAFSSYEDAVRYLFAGNKDMYKDA